VVFQISVTIIIAGYWLSSFASIFDSKTFQVVSSTAVLILLVIPILLGLILQVVVSYKFKIKVKASWIAIVVVLILTYYGI
jgi:hypothetical protein